MTLAKAKQCWFLLHRAQLAPLKWTKIETDAYEFFKSEMLSEFPEFQLCDCCWKLDLWATLNYPSWFKNPIKTKDVLSGGKLMKKVKVWLESPIDLNHVKLIHMDNKHFDNTPMTNPGDWTLPTKANILIKLMQQMAIQVVLVPPFPLQVQPRFRCGKAYPGEFFLLPRTIFLTTNGPCCENQAGFIDPL